MKKIPVALTIAGSDPSGGAGIQADLKTFHQRGVYGMSVVTLLTVQNTLAVRQVIVLKPREVIAQLEAVLEDIPPQAIKTGALGNAGVVRALARRLKKVRVPLVIDPVMISKHGAPLMAPGAREIFGRELLPLADLITPNLAEAELLTGVPVRDVPSMKTAAKKLCAMGARAALVKGGHLQGWAVDVFCAGGRFEFFRSRRVRTRQTHGTGCTFSAAIAAELAKGNGLSAAIKSAKRFITRAIQTAPGLGRGCGPVNHHARV